MSGGRCASSFACLLIVAAFRAQLCAAAAASEDVPVPGGVAALAQSLGIDPVPDRARFMHEVTRLVYDAPELRNPAVGTFLQSLRQSARAKGGAPRVAVGPADIVPIPLTANVWSEAIFHRKVAAENMVLTIVADREAALLCLGLSQLDDETLEFFASHTAMLTRLYERSAPLFAAFGGSIRIHDNRVVPPGGDEAVPLWEAAAGERVARAERFVITLLETNEGRLAFLYNSTFELDPARRAFILGSWLPESLRPERFRQLTTAGLAAVREWHPRMMPFGRGSYDFGMAMVRLAVREDGMPLPPASRSFWARVLGTSESSGGEDPVDAAWIFEHVLSADVRLRADRLDQLGFAQRVFRDQVDDKGELVFLLKSMPRFRALFLAFERAGFRNIATYATAVRQAIRVAGIDGRKGYLVQAQFQGSLAILLRMVDVRSIDIATGERLVTQVSALPVNDGYAGGLAQWLRTTLHPLLPASHDVESAMIAGLSGPTVAAGGPRVTWEGQLYRLDLAAAERQRLERVREKQHAPAIDVPLQMAEAARLLADEKTTLADLQDAATQFEALADDLPQRSREEEADNVPAGVAPPAAPREALRKAVEELGRAVKNQDAKRASRIAEPIIEIADDLLARNLLSFAYAISLGDPDGTVLLANDVSHRHDFGLGAKDSEVRARISWSIPRQEVVPGVPWHMSGSLLGLDAGLATLALRRVATDHPLEAPKLTNNTRDMLATTVSLMDPNALRDADRDAIGDAIERGRRRVVEATDAATLDGITADLRLEMSRHRAVRWTLVHERERLLDMFTLTELLVLGGGDLAALHAWGTAVIPVTGCLCSRLFPPDFAALLGGRPQLGIVAAALPDVNFRVAMVLKELGLPAPLAKVILSGAVQDFIDEVRPTDDGDLLSLSRAAAAITRERIEDYIAAATATGPLMPEPNRTPQPVP